MEVSPEELRILYRVTGRTGERGARVSEKSTLSGNVRANGSRTHRETMKEKNLSRDAAFSKLLADGGQWAKRSPSTDSKKRVLGRQEPEGNRPLGDKS